MQLGSLKEVVAQDVHDGQSIALERCTHLIPFAAGHGILRQRKRDIHVLRDLHERTRIAHAGSVLSSPKKFPSATIANQV